MRILYIASCRLPTEKAEGYQVMKMAEAFAQKHDILLLYPARRNVKELAGVDDVFSYYNLDNRFAIKKLFCLDLVLLRKLGLSRPWFWLHSLTYAVSVLLWVRRHGSDFELIYSRAPLVLYLLSRSKRVKRLRRAGLKLVFEAHSFPRRQQSCGVKVAGRVDRLVAVTRKIAERYIQAGVEKNRTLVEPDAVDLASFDISTTKEESRKKLALPRDITIAAFVGKFHTMEMEKGIPEIIVCATYLVDEFPALYFYFVGGPLAREKKYRKMVADCGLAQERFVFLEKQPVKDVPLWLKASDVLLMPHPRNTFYAYYVSPLKMFEYMAARRPIVGSRLPAIEEILVHKESALLGEPGKAQDIAENIGKLLREPRMAERLATRAFADVKKYTWTKRAERILACLN